MAGEDWKPLSVVAKLCYGMAGLGPQMTWVVLGAYSSIFLVEVAQVPPLFASAILFGSRSLDSVCNFVIGPLIDRTDTRWGKLKPWILSSGLMLVPLYCLVWYVPGADRGGKLAWYLVFYCLWMLIRTAYVISHRTMVMFLSDKSEERNSAVVFRSLFDLLGAVAGMAIHGQIVAAYDYKQSDSCGNSTRSNSSIDVSTLTRLETGYMIAAGIVSGLSLVGFLPLLFGTTERKDISKTSGIKTGRSLFAAIKPVMTFRPNIYLLLILFCCMFFGSMLQGSTALYLEFALDLRDQIQNVFLISAVCSGTILPVVGKLTTKFGHRIPYMCLQGIGFPVVIGLWFIPRGSMAVVAVLFTFGSVIVASGILIPWLMLNDVIEDCYLQTGKRLDTLFYSAALSAVSLGLTTGLGSTSVALEIGGYKTGACIQSDTVGTALRILCAFGSSSILLLTLLLTWRFPITEKRREEINKAIKERNDSGPSGSTNEQPHDRRNLLTKKDSDSWKDSTLLVVSRETVL